jgi:hypothetical protein
VSQANFQLGWGLIFFTLSYRDVEELLAERRLDLRNRPILGAEIRTGDRATATPVPTAAEGAGAAMRVHFWASL